MGEVRKKNEWREEFEERLLQFGIDIVLLSNKLPKTPAGFAVAGQLVKSGTSMGANFIEAHDASSLKDFVQKLSISLRESRETYYWLAIIKGSNLLPDELLEKETKECNELISILVTSIKSAKNRT